VDFQSRANSSEEINGHRDAMKKLILISLVLNFALLGATAYFVQKNSASRVDTESASRGKVSSEHPRNRKARPKIQTVDVRVDGEKFSWRSVESADYKEYIANLRGIQCPEETIRDIIIADVNKFYAEQLKPLRKPAEPYRYWRNDRNWGGRRESDEFYAAQKRIEKEKKTLLAELLGEKYEDIFAQQYGVKKIKDEFSEKLSQEAKDQLSEIQQRFSDQKSEIYRKAKGYIDSDTQAELRKIDQQQTAEMAKILSPEDLFEWQLRHSETVQNMKWNELRGFDASEDEFRAIAKAKLSAESALGDVDPESSEARDARRKAQKEADEALKTALGEDRFKDYQRNQDWEYRNLAQIAERQGVAKEEVAKVYEMKDDVQKAARDINKDKTLTPEQRREKLLAVKQATEEAVQASLGNRGFKAWKNNAWWLRNIVPPPNEVPREWIKPK
jgi:hypothetical protein